MADIVPFRALRYDPKKAKASMDDLVAPPYDVISVEQQEALYRRNQYNVVRLILGKQSDADSPTDNRYTRSAGHLKEWIEGGILKEDAALSFYVYEQTFEVRMGHPPKPRSFTRRGVLTALKLEPFGTGKVYPHEETFPSHKADRLQLFKACRANFSPVFGLVPDEGSVSKLLALAATQRAPDVEIREDSGIINRLWVVSDPSFVKGLTDALAPRGIFIADGHHRYETACNYQKERREQATAQGPQPYDYVLMMCVPMSDTGLIILPTHRLLQPEGDFNIDAFLKSVEPLFDQKPVRDEDLYALAETTEGPVSFGLALHKGRTLKLTAKSAVADVMRSVAPKKSDAWRGLDTAILQELLIKKVLGQDKQPPAAHSGLCFTKDVGEVLDVIGKGTCQLGLVMRPTMMEHVRAVAEHGERMPQKSTYFSPKLLSGLVMRRL